jgi:predicted phage terminase large subunit-like protein
VLIEDTSTGASLLQELGDQTAMPLLAFEPTQDKVTRLGVESPAIEAGNVWLPESAEWLSDFEREIANFPNASTADQGDMVSMTLKHFREGGAFAGPRLRSL